MRKKAREIFSDKAKPCLTAQRATQQLRKRVRDKGRASRNKKDDDKPFIQKTLPRSIYKEIERERVYTHTKQKDKQKC